MNKNALFEQLHITEKHTGKMSGMLSLSSCCLCNKHCQEYSKNKQTICAHCYASAQLKRYKNTVATFTKNGELLSGGILNSQQLPTINARFFRFEAFGDLLNATHCINFFNIAKKNKYTQFALFTKNIQYVAQAIAAGHKKPDNLQIIYSSLLLNTASDKMLTKYPFIDKIFTVYDKQHADAVAINCGAKRCIDCLLCYTKNDVQRINERLK